MTKKLVWRLKEQPTSEMLRELVKDKILTKDEAREILFNLQEESGRDNESLKSEIKFLRELVEKLANSQKVVKIIREIESPYYSYRWWRPYDAWCTNSNQLWTYTSPTGSATGLKNVTTTDSSQNFSDIKTF